ncbi:hypothetical protein HDU86_006043 [Geranomyces michiganensis]|nr:hypothetical protein HDU86_006043 [Geranomyces michiganensis]
MSVAPMQQGPPSVTALDKQAVDRPTRPEPVASAPYDQGNEYEDSGEEEENDDDEFEDAPQDLEDESAGSPTTAKNSIHNYKIDKKALKAGVADAERNLYGDIADAQKALDMFLDSKMVESEQFLRLKYGQTLYHTLGFAIVSWLKACMTFEPSDVDTATETLRAAMDIATLYRKDTSSLVGSLASMVLRTNKDPLKNMTPLQRHAELASAEACLLKAILSLVTDTNMVAFVREGLAIRTAYNTYKSCYRFLQRTFDEEGGAEGLVKNNVDEHFVSGILLGVGSFNVILSMLPAKVLRLFELIGFSGDRDFGLSRLEIGGTYPPRDRSATHPASKRSPKGSRKNDDSASGAGGRHVLHREDSLAASAQGAIAKVPFAMPLSADGTPRNGLRKALCDTTLLAYHIILSSTVQLPDCDIPFAKEILKPAIARYPNSFIFLALRARLHQTEGDPDGALEQYARVMGIQNEWRQLVHVCVWDSGTCHAALGNWAGARDCYDVLFKESKWSKAIYRYLQAVYTLAADPESARTKVTDMLAEVPKLTRKVAGKSIPLEKFVSRKCRKWTLQNNALVLPHLEILYVLNGFDVIPATRVPDFIAQVDAVLKELDAKAPASDSAAPPYKTYYDDVCLVRFLKGVLTRDTAIPNSLTLAPVQVLAAAPAPTPVQQATLAYAARQLEHTRHFADRIALDHWLLPFSRLELGKLYVRAQEYGKARREFEAALNNGYAEDEVGASGGKKKISLENTLHFRVHNALVKLDVLERLVKSRDN